MKRSMDAALYLLALTLVRFLQALPVRWVARLGRAGGALAYLIDARHRGVAQRNLTLCLGGERSAGELRAVAKEHFRRLGENYCCAVKTATMTWEQVRLLVEFTGSGRLAPDDSLEPPRSFVLAIGHFGNWELYARLAHVLPRMSCATTYRGLPQPRLDRLMQSLRAHSPCVYFERRTDAAALKNWMAPTGRGLGLLADQHAGSGGVRVPFFGHDCATTASPAVFALRYDCALYPAICYRIGLARWRIETGDEIPTREQGRARSVEAITRDINRAFEAAVRRDPANWFWVHNRWKPARLKGAQPGPKLPAATPQRAEAS